MIHSNYDTFHHRFILFSTLLMIEKNIKTFIKIRIHKKKDMFDLTKTIFMWLKLWIPQKLWLFFPILQHG